MKPVEQKLKYQIDKVVKAANEAAGGSSGAAKGAIVGWEGEESEVAGRGGVSEMELKQAGVSDPLQFKPNPMNLAGAMKGFDKKDKDLTSTSSVYRPPKIAPVKYTETSTKSKSTLSTATRESLSKSRVFRDMRETFDTSRPEQVTSHGTGYGLRELRDAKDEELQKIEEFEEGNYGRLGATKDRNKRERAMMRKSGTSGIVDEMENLESDFLQMESLDRAVAFDQKQQYGASSGVLSKRNKRADFFGGEEAGRGKVDDQGRKRKTYADAQDMLSKQAKITSSKTAYDRTVKKMKSKK
ncbi:hypothetical protein HDU98_009148 [Podochytrium sp. JEL0797]|nr:hypothetical protein HDU98_009148 [Podochytrium sp. JEL0797]